MLTIDELNALQQNYAAVPELQAACFPKEEVIALLESIRNNDAILYLKVVLVRTEIDGTQKESMAICGGNKQFQKAGEGILSILPCPPYCGH